MVDKLEVKFHLLVARVTGYRQASGAGPCSSGYNLTVVRVVVPKEVLLPLPLLIPPIPRVQVSSVLHKHLGNKHFPIHSFHAGLLGASEPYNYPGLQAF